MGKALILYYYSSKFIFLLSHHHSNYIIKIIFNINTKQYYTRKLLKMVLKRKIYATSIATTIVETKDIPATTPTVNTPIGLCIELSKSTNDKVIDVTITRITYCSCLVCQSNDVFYKGTAMSFRLVDNADRIKVVVCPNRSTAYALKQTIYKLPEGTVLVANYEALKHRIFKPDKFILAFREDKTSDNHVKIIYIESIGLQLWIPVVVNEQPFKEDGNSLVLNVKEKALFGSIPGLISDSVIR
jgi:hypothetical protein